MSYLRDKDEACYLLCKLQSRLFERASDDGIPSSYFAKVYFNSRYGEMMDDLSYLEEYPSDYEIYGYVKAHVRMKRGTVLPPHVMAWIGYLLRQWAYVYRVRSKSILKRVPISYLAQVYGPYHALDVQKAIELIAHDRGIDLGESPDDRVMRILKTGH